MLRVGRPEVEGGENSRTHSALPSNDFLLRLSGKLDLGRLRICELCTMLSNIYTIGSSHHARAAMTCKLYQILPILFLTVKIAFTVMKTGETGEQHNARHLGSYHTSLAVFIVRQQEGKSASCICFKLRDILGSGCYGFLQAWHQIRWNSPKSAAHIETEYVRKNTAVGDFKM